MLQLRLTHPLGQQLVEVEPRFADRPIVVGRAASADVEVPHPTVAKSHCLLFLHAGHWVVQDARTTAGTYLNRQRITQPEFLSSDDTITLGRGPDAPTLTVDPHHLGVSEEITDRPAPATRPAPPAPVPTPPLAPPVAPRGLVTSVTEAPTPQPTFVQDDEERPEEEEDNILPKPAPRAIPTVPSALPPPPTPYRPPQYTPQSYPAPAGYTPAAPATPQEPTGWENVRQEKRLYVPKPKRTSAGAVTAVVILSAILLAGGIYAIYYAYQKQKEETTPKIVVIPSTRPATTLPKPTSIFDQNADNAKLLAQRAATQKAAAPVAPPLPKPTAEMANVKPGMEGAPIDIKTGDADWDAVEEARRMSNSSGDQRETALAVVKLYDYRDRFAGKNDKAIDAYLDEAADALWWKRIAELFEERDAAQKEIADRKLQITQSQDANFKKDLEAEIVKWAEQRDRADEALRIQMKFTRQSPPNLYDSQDRAALRTERDPEMFQKWKANVLSAIKSSRGQRLPWRSSR